MRHCNMDDMRPELRRELEAVKAYCQAHSIPVVVEVEELCLKNVPEEPTGTASPYCVPDHQKHRLVSSSTHSSTHYQWLCFVTPARTLPPDTIGLPGDIWVTAASRAQKLHYRSSTGWRHWQGFAKQGWLAHPFAADLFLAFGVSKLGWFPMELIDKVFPAAWKLQGGRDEYQHVPPSAAVKALYETTGRPIAQGGVSSSAAAPHRCDDESRASKQWHADRVRLYVNFHDRPEDDRVSQPRPLVARDDSSVDPVSVTQISGPEDLAEHEVVLRIGDGGFRKVNLQYLKRYAKNAEPTVSAPKVVIGPTGAVRVCDLELDIDLGALNAFLDLVESDFQPSREHSTSELLRVLRICAGDKLRAPAVKQFVKHRLCETWSFSFASVSQGRLADAPEALIAARYNGLPQVKKRAIFELMRSSDSLDDILKCDQPREWFLSDQDVDRLWRAREVLEATWSAFIMDPPKVLFRTCPTYGELSPCSAARRQLVDEWPVAVGQSMVEGEYQYDPIGGLDELVRMDWRSFRLCIGCVRAMVQLCEEKKAEWWERFDGWIQPEVWCVDEEEVEPDDDGNMPYVDSDDEGEDSGESEEIDELEDDDGDVDAGTDTMS
ncbi:hypothetical protein C8T65DRAFT_72877 [Cerioporus squamosus]|nr:hypothetical protein C8T65DRAFT_72877 [Cerioporus squamosus]